MFHTFLKPHRSSLLANTTSPQKLFALLKVLPTATSAQNRPPLAWVFVIDGSGSMREKFGGSTKIEIAAAAARRILDDHRISPDDLISIIEFDDKARVLSPLSPLGDGAIAHAALDKLHRFQGGTQMGEGLQSALNELARLRTDVHIAKRVLVLTDGETSDAPRCLRQTTQFLNMNAPLITLGVGDKYNESLLGDLSERSQGRPYHLGNSEDLHRVLEDEVDSSTREVLGEVQMKVQSVRGATLNSVTRVYPHLSEVASVNAAGANAAGANAGENNAAGAIDETAFALGNIVAGDYSVWTLEFTIAGLARPLGGARLAQIVLSGREGAQQTQGETLELGVSFDDDQSATTVVDSEVLGYVQQRNADRLMRDASQLAATDATAAQQKLQVALNMTRQVGNIPLTKTLEIAMEELARTGTLSSGRRKTVMFSGRTRTMSMPSARAGQASGQNVDMTKTDATIPDEAAIRRLTEG